MFEYGEIQKLAELFNPPKENSDSEDELENVNDESTTDKNSEKKESSRPKKINPYTKIETKENPQREVLDPDDEDLFFGEQESRHESEWKKTPTWDIAYKQQVTASDVFLQVGLKSPSTASCEDMIITINLPGEKRQNMDLKIKSDRLTLISPRFYLDIPLPHPVDPQKGNAQFNAEAEELIITLRMDRELDLVNF